MRLSQLHIEGLRNIDATDLSFGSGFNYLFGANGAGKTAVLEAVHLLARGRSFRAQSIDRLVSASAKQMLLRAEVSNSSGSHSMGISRSGGTSDYRLDGARAPGSSQLIQHLAVQTLLPDASDLIYGGPGGRRAFLDWGLFHVKHGFIGLSRQFNRALRQRNAWLKTASGEKDHRASGTGEFDPWLGSLVDFADQLNEARGRYTEALSVPFSRAVTRLSGDLSIELDYDPGGLAGGGDSHKKMSESFARDVKFGITHRGPHRADLAIHTLSPTASVASSGAKVGSSTRFKAAEVLSRGQAKVAASALMLAQVELQQSATGQGSVVLIDDFGAELDLDHWRRFVEMLEGLDCQVIVTSTQAPDTQGLLSHLECDVFHVEHGRVRPV